MLNNILDQIRNNNNQENSKETQTPESSEDIVLKTDKMLNSILGEPTSQGIGRQEFSEFVKPDPSVNLSEENTLRNEDITQSDFNNWWNNMKQAWDSTQKSTYESAFNKAQLIIDKNDNLKDDWIKARRLNLIDDEKLNSKLSELEEQNLEAAKKRNDAEEGIKTNEQEIANEYVSKTYKINEAIVNGKGADATYGEALQYTLPSGLGSMGSMMVSSFIATFGKQALTKAAVAGLEVAGVSAETGPGAAVAGGLAFLGQMAVGAYARYSETEAELGDNVEGVKQKLIQNWFEKYNPTGDPNGPQPSEYDLRQIRIQSMDGVDDLMKENYALFAEDALSIVIGSSMFKGSSIIRGLGEVGEYNKYTRMGKALGLAYTKNVTEKFEEGLQYAASKRQESKALGLEDYEDKGFMSNLLSDSYDTATSINLGLPYQGDTNLGGRYSEDKEFQASAEVGGMLGLLGGGSAAAIKITKDISKYLETSRDLKAAGAINPDDKVFRLKNQIYQKNFEKNSVPFLLEGIRNLRTVKNEMGEPMMNDEQAAEETKNILNAYEKYKQVNEHLEGIKPAGFAGIFQSKEQAAMLNVAKQELFHTSMEIARNSNKLPILASLDNIKNLIDNQQRIVDAIKQTKDSSSLKKTYNLNERLKIAEAKLNQLKLNKKMIMERDGIKEKELPEASSVEQSNANKEYLINDLNLSELKTKYDNLLKIKTNDQLKSWFVNHAKGVFEKMKESDPNIKEGLEETEAENSVSDLLMPDVELSHAKEFKTKFKGEYDSLLVEFKDKKGISQKLDHLNKINAVLQKAKAEVDKHVKTFLNSPTGEYYKSVSEKLSKEIEVNNQKIKTLDVKNKDEKTNPSVKIIDAVSKLTTMFVGFLDEAQLKELDVMSQIDILNSAEIRIEDYEDANQVVEPIGLDKKPIENTSVKIITGLNSEKNKGKGVYIYVNGKRIGGLLDPRRFLVSGKPFNPGNMKHLAALNPDFVQKNENGVSEPTAQGEAMQSTYAGLVKAFEALEEKGSFTNDEVQEYFYVNRTGSIEYVKGEEKPKLGESLSNKGYEIEYSFKNSDDELITKSGVIIVKFKNESISNIYLRNADGTISEIVRENSPTEFSKIESIYNERHNEIKKGLESKYGNDSERKLTGQFFVLVNNPSAKSKLDILSASFPSIEKDVTEGSDVLTNLSEMIIAQDKKITEAKDDDIIDGVTLTSNEGNFFISASGLPGVKIEIGMTGIFKDKRSDKKEDDKRQIGALKLKISLPGVQNNITLFSKQKTSFDGKKSLGRGELNLMWGEDEDGSIMLVHENPVTKKVTKITTSAQLLSALNADIKLYASRKGRDGKVYDKNKKLEKLKLEGFKLAVDEESAEGDFNSLNNMKLNAIPVRSSVSFKPKKVEAAKQKSKPSEVNSGLAINQINSFIDDINSANKINLPLFYSMAKAFIKENGLEKYSDALDSAYEKRLTVLNEEAGKSSKSDSQIASNDDQMREIQLNIDEINSQLKLSLLDTSITKAETDALKEQRDELQEQLRALGMNGSDRNSPFKIGDVNPTSNPIDIEVAKARLKKMLPNWISTELVDTIAHNLGENGEAWGRFMDNIVYISKSARQGVEYHEAFHAVFRTILTRPQYKQLISEAKIKYEKYTEEDLKRIQSYYKDKIQRDQLIDLYYEEKMADEFQKYAEGKESRSLLTRIFDAIKALGRFFFDNRSQMDIVFSNIYNGVYKNSEPVLGILRRSETPAFKLIPKADKWNEKEQRKESGFLSQSQSERIINTIAMNVIKRTNVPTPEIIKEEVMKMVNYYDISNFSNELRQVNEKSKSEFDRIYNSIQEVSDALKNTKTQSEIADAVEIRTALFNYEDVNEKENTEDDANDDGYVFNQSTFTIGGWGSLSKEMKQFMAFTEVNVDEFGFKGLIGDEEMKSKKFNMASNGFVIYTGVERALADTPKNKILKKLILYSNQTEHAKAFKDNLIKVISNELGVEVDENTSIDILKNSDWFNKFASTFVKNKVSQAVVVFDPTNKFFKAFKSNQRDESTFQVDEWSKAYLAMGRNKEMNRKDNIAILEALNEIIYSDNYIAGKDNDGGIKPLGSTVSEFINIMKKLGIELSSGYVRFSLIANKIDFIESKYNKALESGNTEVAEYFKGLIDEFEMFDDADPFTSDDIKGILSSLDSEDENGNKNNNPFAVLVDAEGNITDTGAIGRMKNIAANNAIFDESVTGSTFQNAKGDTVFDKILPSYLTSELAKWRDEARREFIDAVRKGVSDEDGWRLLKKAIEADGGYMEDYLVKTFYQSIKNNPLILGVEYEKSNDGKDTNKIIYNDDFSDLIFDNIKTYIADGLRAVSFNEVRDEEEEGGNVYNLEEESYKRSTGNTYANLDPRTKTIMAMSLFARGTSSLSNDNNKLRTKKRIAGEGSLEKRSRTLSQFIFSVIETKSTQNMVTLPVQNFVNNDGTLNSLGMDYLKRSLMQEYERIGKAEKEIKDGTDFFLEGFHNKEQRGLDFFNFSYLKSIDETFYNKMVDSAKAGVKFSDLNSEIEDLLNKFYKEQFDKWVDLLVKRGAISKKESEEGIITYENKSLPNDYQENDKQINMKSLADFFSNDYLMSININNLLHGDLATSYKSHNDVVKRNAKLIGSGPTLGSDRTTIAVVKSVEARDRADYTEGASNIDGLAKTDTTDAQNLNTLDWFQNKYLKSLGKSNPEVKRLISKIRKGYKLSWSESQYLIKSNASITSRKIVGGDTFFYDKTSTATLLRSVTSFVDAKDRQALDKIYDLIDAELDGNRNKARLAELYTLTHNYWKPMPNSAYNHYLLNKMEMSGTDILAFDSSMKQIKPNVSSMPKIPSSAFDFQLNNFDVSDSVFREQVNTDSIKKYIIHPTQLLNLIWSEQDRSAKGSIFGKERKVGEIADAYLHFLGKRVEDSFQKIKESIIENNKPKYKKLLKEFQNSLDAQNSDPYIQEFFKMAEGISDNPKYNLNFPATLIKFENMWLSYVSKAMKIKTPGHKFTLKSDFGDGVMHIGERIVTDAEFRRSPSRFKNIKVRKLAWKKQSGNEYVSECKISAQFAEQYGLKIGDKIPEALARMFGVRIPTQDKHSMVSLIVVDFLPAETGNIIVLPLEIVRLSGADFDIDSLFARIYTWYNNKFKNKVSVFGDYLKEETNSNAIAVAHDEYLANAVRTDEEYKERLSNAMSSSEEYNNITSLLNSAKKAVKNLLLENKDALNENVMELVDDFESRLEEAGRDAFEFDEDGNYVESKNTSTVQEGFNSIHEKKVLKMMKTILSEDSKAYENEVKAPLNNLIKEQARIKEELSNQTLELLGYKTKQSEFSDKFGKQVSSNRMAFESGSLEDIVPFNKAETDNILLEMEFALLHNNSDLSNKISASPSTTKMFDDADNMLKANGINVEAETLGVASPLDKSIADENNSTGAKGIGPAAVFNVMFQRLNRYGIKLIKGFDKVLGHDSFGSYINDSGQRINDGNSSILSVHTDNAKDPKAGRYNISQNTIGAVLNNNGMGIDETVNLFMSKQEIMSELNRNFDLKKSEIASKTEKDFTDKSIAEYSIKAIAKKYDIDMKDFEIDDSVIIDVKTLTEALKFSEGLQTDMTKNQFLTLQKLVMDTMLTQRKYAEFLRNMVDVLGLLKGMKKTWAESDKVFDAIKKLGIEMYLKKSSDPNKLDSYDFRHVDGFAEDSKEGGEMKYPFDLLPIFKNDKLINVNMKVFKMINIYGEKFFITRTPLAEKIKSKVSSQMRAGFMDYEDNRNSFSRSLISYFTIASYRNMFSKSFKIDDLFNNKLHKKLYSLLSKEEFKNNEFLKFLNATSTEYSNKRNKSIFEGLTLYKLEGNTRTKNNPDFVTLLMDGFRQLNSSLDDEAKDFTVDAFNYLVMKDGLQFKNNSFIRQIEPYFLSRMTSSLDIVQDLLSNDKTIHSFRSVFGTNEDQVMNDFVELFTSDKNNSFSLKYLNNFDVSKKMKENILKSLNSPEELANMTSEEKKEFKADLEKADLEENAPLLFTSDRNGTRVMVIDLFAGIEKNDTKKEKSRLAKANKSSLLSFKGMFQYRKDGITLPLVFVYNNKSSTGKQFKNYYKLKSYIAKDSDGEDKAFNVNEMNGKEMHEGHSAVYEEFKPWGSQETSVYPFSPKEWKSFAASRELEIAKTKEEDKKLEISEKKTILISAIEKQKNEIYDFLNSEKASIISPEQKKDIMEALKNASTEKEISEIIQTKIC